MNDELKKEEEMETPNMDNPITDYQKLSEENLNGWRRAMADYQNLKKENETKFREGRQAGQEEAMEKIIPIVGYFQKAVDNVPADLEASKQSEQWLSGIKHIQKYFLDALESFGLVRIETAGKKFDPNEHEPIGEEETPDGVSGDILKEVSPGFKRDGKVIVPAKVIIKK